MCELTGSRARKIFTPENESSLTNFQIPDDFYMVTKGDAQRFQAGKTQDATRELTLRTQDMRQAERDRNKKTCVNP